MDHAPSLTPEALHRLLSRRDLTDPLQGRHPIQDLVIDIRRPLARLKLPVRHAHSGPVRPAREGERPGPKLVAAPIDLLEQGLLAIADNEEHPVLLCTQGSVHGLHATCGGQHLHGHLLGLWLLPGASGPAPEAMAEVVREALRATLSGAEYRLLPMTDPCLERAFRIELRHAGDWIGAGLCGRYVHPRAGAVQGVLLELDELLALRDAVPERNDRELSEAG